MTITRAPIRRDPTPAMELLRRIAYALELHKPSERGYCRECGFRSPCPTSRVLKGEPADGE